MKSIGIDLGQAGDYAAAIALRDGIVVGIHRWELHTSYTQVASDIEKILDKSAPDHCFVDATGVGRPVVERIRRPIVRVTTTAAPGEPHWGPYGYYVPKQFLISRLMIGIQSGEVAIDNSHPMAAALLAELSTYRRNIRKSGAVTYEAMRAKDHDDLVVALALANLVNTYVEPTVPQARDIEKELRELFNVRDAESEFDVVDFRK